MEKYVEWQHYDMAFKEDNHLNRRPNHPNHKLHPSKFIERNSIFVGLLPTIHLKIKAQV